MAKKEINPGQKAPLGVTNTQSGWFVPDSAPTVPRGVIYTLSVILIIAAIAIGYLGIYGPSVDQNEAARARLEQKRVELRDVQ